MQEFVLASAIGTCVLLIALTAFFGNRKGSRKDVFLERVRALKITRFIVLREEMQQRTGQLKPAPLDARVFAELTDASLREELRHEALQLEGQINEIVADHRQDFDQVGKPFETVLTEVLHDDPYVAPLLLSRYDQTAAEKRHHQRCREIAVARHSRNQQIRGRIVTLRAHIDEAKRG